jgi:hypothetical protein
MNASNVPCLRIGDETGTRVLFVPPLFEEANRMRRTLVLTMRALAGRGIASLLPDLPGQNDSLQPTETADLDSWRTALATFAAAEDAPIVVASVRGGALIDDGVAAAAWWRLAPAAGAGLLRTMLRSRVASDRETGVTSSIDSLLAEAAAAPLQLAGNQLSPAMIAGLQAATPATAAPLRQVSLGSGEGEITGTPLWLRAEPGEDRAMAAAMADDIAEWISTCGAR